MFPATTKKTYIQTSMSTPEDEAQSSDDDDTLCAAYLEGKLNDDWDSGVDYTKKADLHVAVGTRRVSAVP